MTQPAVDELIDAVRDLALDIARLCPDCGDKAQRLVALVGQIRPAGLDRAAVRDAIETEAVGSDLSNAQVSSTAEAVIRAVDDGER